MARNTYSAIPKLARWISIQIQDIILGTEQGEHIKDRRPIWLWRMLNATEAVLLVFSLFGLMFWYSYFFLEGGDPTFKILGMATFAGVPLLLHSWFALLKKRIWKIYASFPPKHEVLYKGVATFLGASAAIAQVNEWYKLEIG